MAPLPFGSGKVASGAGQTMTRASFNGATACRQWKVIICKFLNQRTQDNISRVSWCIQRWTKACDQRWTLFWTGQVEENGGGFPVCGREKEDRGVSIGMEASSDR